MNVARLRTMHAVHRQNDENCQPASQRRAASSEEACMRAETIFPLQKAMEKAAKPLSVENNVLQVLSIAFFFQNKCDRL